MNEFIRNNNGEWVSSTNVVFMDKEDVETLEELSSKYDVPLSPQNNLGCVWYYRHELDQLKRAQVREKTINFYRALAKAELGDPDSQLYVGLCLFKGRGIPRDEEEALAWIRKAAEQDHPIALKFLREYFEGRK